MRANSKNTIKGSLEYTISQVEMLLIMHWVDMVRPVYPTLFGSPNLTIMTQG